MGTSPQSISSALPSAGEETCLPSSSTPIRPATPVDPLPSSLDDYKNASGKLQKRPPLCFSHGSLQFFLDHVKQLKAQFDLSQGVPLHQSLIPEIVKGHRKELREIETQLKCAHSSSLEDRKQALGALWSRAVQYLQLSFQFNLDPNAVQSLRAGFRPLAGEAFGILARFSERDPDPSIRGKFPLFFSLSQLSKTSLGEVLTRLESFKDQVPIAEQALKDITPIALKLLNVAAVGLWEVYNQERGKYEIETGMGIGHQLLHFGLRSIFDERTHLEEWGDRWADERLLVGEVKKKILRGQAGTIREGLDEIRKNGKPEIRKIAEAYFIQASYSFYNVGPRLLRDDQVRKLLVRYSSEIPLRPAVARLLLKETDFLEGKGTANHAAFGIYSLIEEFSPEPSLQRKVQEGKLSIWGSRGLLRMADHFIFSKTWGDVFSLAAGNAGKIFEKFKPW